MIKVTWPTIFCFSRQSDFLELMTAGFRGEANESFIYYLPSLFPTLLGSSDTGVLQGGSAYLISSTNLNPVYVGHHLFIKDYFGTPTSFVLPKDM